MVKETSSRKGDEESVLTHAELEHHTYPYAADEISLPIQNKPPASSDEDANPDGGTKNPRDPNSSPPWRCDQRIYSSRFVISCFWGSQLGILSLTALFVVFYFELFVPIGVPSFAKLHATLQTDFGIWFIVASTVLAWLGVAILLLTGGALFSSLFKLDLDLSGEQEASQISRVTRNCRGRASTDRVA